MLRNYLIVAIRGYMRNKVITGINVIGLATAMAATLIILQYVAHQFSYDHNYEDGEDIYRVAHLYNWTDSKGNQTLYLPFVWEDFAERLENDFPEVTMTTSILTRIVEIEGRTERRDKLWLSKSGLEDAVMTENFVTADPHYFDIFNDKDQSIDKNALNDPDCAVVSRSLALSVFGTDDVVNRILLIDGKHQKKITAVYDPPVRSSVQYEVIFSPSKKTFQDEVYQAFMKVRHDTNMTRLFRGVAEKMPEYMPILYREASEVNLYTEPIFQPLYEAHFARFSEDELTNVTYSKNVFYLLGLIGLLISAIALANYFNLTSAQMMSRSKEVGVRKIVGATIQKLFWQNILESMMIIILAFALAITVAQTAHPYLSVMGLRCYDQKYPFRKSNG